MYSDDLIVCLSQRILVWMRSDQPLIMYFSRAATKRVQIERICTSLLTAKHYAKGDSIGVGKVRHLAHSQHG